MAALLYHWYILIVLLSSVGTLILALITFKRHSSMEAVFLSGLLISITWWGMTSVFQGSLTVLGEKILNTHFMYLGIVTTPLFIFLFILKYTRQDAWFEKKIYLPFLIIPLLTILSEWTNSRHHLFDVHVFLNQHDQVADFVMIHGPLFWVHAVYSYSLLALSIYFLVKSILRSKRKHLRQQMMVLLAICVPWLANIITVVNIIPVSEMDLSPLTFAITGAFLFLAVFRYGLFDVVNFAQSVIVSHMQDGVIVLNEVHEILEVNPALLHWVNRPANQVIGIPIEDLFAVERLQDLLDHPKEQEEEVDISILGEDRIFCIKISPIFNEQGEFNGTILILDDETEKKKQERNIFKINELLERIFNNTNFLLAYLDCDLKFQRVNRSFSEQFGVSSEEMYGKSLYDFFKTPRLAEMIPQTLQQEVMFTASADPFLMKKGDCSEITYWNWSVQPIKSKDQQIEGLVLTLIDVTDREKAGQSLADAMEINQKIITASSVGISLYDSRGNCVLTNQVAAGFWDQTVDDHLRTNFYTIKGWKTSGLLQAATTVLDSFQPHNGVYSFIRPSGIDTCLNCSLTSLIISGERHLLVMSLDISVQQRALNELIRSESRFHTLVDSMNDLVFTLNSKGMLEEFYGNAGTGNPADWNAPTRQIDEEGEIDYLNRLPKQEIQRTLRGEPTVFEMDVTGKQETHYIQTSLAPIYENRQIAGIVGVGRDISALKSMELDLEEAKMLLEQAFIQSPAPMVLIRNTDGEIQMMNEACRLSLKIPITQPLIGMPISSLAVRWTFFDQNGALPEHGNPFELALAGGIFHNAEFELHFYDGSAGWVLFNATPIYNKAGAQIAALIVFADISELKKIESAERDQRILAEAYRDTAAILNSTVQLDTVLTLVLSNIEKIVSHDAAMVVLLNDQGEVTRAQYQGFLPEEEKMALDLCQHLIEINGPRQDDFDIPKTIIISDILQSGRFPKENNFSSLRSFLQVPVFAKGEHRGCILLASGQVGYFSVSHLERLKAFTDQAMIAIENSRLYTEMQNLTLTDELTKIYNFRGLMDLGEREFDRARRFHHPLSIIFFDIDHFRNFNNLYSHAVGNQVLQQTAKLAKNCLRGVDLLTRYGGEEFVVVLPETDLNTATQVAERIRLAIKNQQITTRYGLLGITISAGVAELTKDVPTLASLIDLANQAEHRAKRDGRDQVRPKQQE